MQDLTRLHHVDILVAEEVRETLDPQFALRALPPTGGQGVEKPVATWAVEQFGREISPQARPHA